ncbi:MAG: hypothetical protein RL220_1639 [Bacteroidota bacterium]|jgi:glycosyltransferase involved in cell wall biosynthesis
MQERPLISIIIPTYNSGDTLGAALRSVRNQSYSNLEVLVIDGASRDSTADIAASSGIGNLKFLSEPDKGIYDAINKGIGRSTGDWIYVLGSDDILAAPEVMESLAESIRPGDTYICGCIENIGVKNRFVPHIHCSDLGQEMNWKNKLHQQSVIYHRSLFGTDLFNIQYKVLADYDFHLAMRNAEVQGRNIRLMVAKCAASGLSKRFPLALYKEELMIKFRRLNLMLALVNVPWVCLKFVMKLFGRRR